MPPRGGLKGEKRHAKVIGAALTGGFFFGRAQPKSEVFALTSPRPDAPKGKALRFTALEDR